MQNFEDSQGRLSAELFEAVGGEPLAGSGFETEESEPGFSADELEGEG